MRYLFCVVLLIAAGCRTSSSLRVEIDKESWSQEPSGRVVLQVQTVP